MEYQPTNNAQSASSDWSLLLNRFCNMLDCARHYLVALNCVGMLLSGTLACLGLFTYWERYPNTTKGSVWNHVTLGQVATNPELICLAVGASLFTVFAVGFIRADLLRYYGANPNWDHMMNTLQSKLHCCGIGPASFRDWEHNGRFRCSANNPSELRCGVPASCCRHQNAARVDALCGGGALNASDKRAKGRVHEKGCITALVDLLRGRRVTTASTLMLATLLLAMASTAARVLSKTERRPHSKLESDQRTKAQTWTDDRAPSSDETETSVDDTVQSIPCTDTSAGTDGQESRKTALLDTTSRTEQTRVWTPAQEDNGEAYEIYSYVPHSPGPHGHPEGPPIPIGYYDTAMY